MRFRLCGTFYRRDGYRYFSNFVCNVWVVIFFSSLCVSVGKLNCNLVNIYE